MSRLRVGMTATSSVYRSKVTDKNGKIYYFKGNYTDSNKFKNAIQTWYAINVDSADAESLIFSVINNIGPIANVDESNYIEL